MAFGLSAGAIAAIGSVAAPVIGGLMGGQETGATETRQQTLDPRMQGLLYGNGGNDNGLLNDVNDLRKRQLAQGGLNPYQTAGMEMQRQTFMSPQYMQGYGQMRDMGSQLMGAGVAGNPFSGGGMRLGGGMGGGMQASMSAQPQQQPQMQPFQYQQNEATQGAGNPFMTPPPQAAIPPPQAPAAPDMAAMDAYKQRMAYEQYIQDELRGAGA